MSSWMGDWERGLINRKGNLAKYRTECKLGRHAILVDAPTQWVTDSTLAPLGLSCLPCLKERAAELGREVAAEPAPVAKVAKVPAPRRVKSPEELEHGKAHTYSVHGCHCDPCTAANTERSRRYRAAKRERTAVPA